MEPSSMVMQNAATAPMPGDGHGSSLVDDIDAFKHHVDASDSGNSALSEPSPDADADFEVEDEVEDGESSVDDDGDDNASNFELNDAGSSSEDESVSEQYSPLVETATAVDTGDSPMEDAAEEKHATSASDHSSTQGSKRGAKRKSTFEDDEYIRNNPTLYGLRRSGRARSTRQPVMTLSDSDSEPPTKRRRGNTAARSSRHVSSSPSSDVLSDSSDSYTERTSRRQKARHRRSSDKKTPPVHGELRFSTRRVNKVATYREDDDDDELFGEDSELMTPVDVTMTVDDNPPAIDVVLNHRFKQGVDPNKQEVGRNDCEFYIKWQGKSHYHATWETVESLSGCRSMRRLDNYVRKVLSYEISLMVDPETILEEKERWNLDRERDLEAIEDYKKVERVIGSREIDGKTEYYVKWKRLPYESCTWETTALVSEIAQPEIDRYLDRCSHPPISDKTESNPATRAPFEPIHGSPDFIKNGQLKDFQVKGVNFMAFNWVRGRNVVLADEMGLGKTVQTVAFINWLRHVRRQNGPFIVVVPLSTLPAWAETFDYWTPDLNYVVYGGNESSRNIIKEYELLIDGNLKRPKFHVLLTTYEYALSDAVFLSQFKWQFMAVDEAHRLKNRDSQLYAKLKAFKAPSRLLITGTPIQNNLGELSALMDFLNPGLVKIDEDMDLSSEAASIKLAELTKAIQPFMLRRTKSKVENDLPPKSEKIIRVELSDIQLEYYKNILTKNYAALNEGAKGQKQSLLNIMMELKKASNHPFMFPNAETRILQGSTRREDYIRALITSSGKMMLLDQLLTKLKNDGHRVLIFSQMVKMLDILADYMDARGYAFQRLDGTISAAQRRLAIEQFNAPDSSDFAFLLSTRAGGLGINLMTADTVILFDSDWNPQADLQAMARAHRIGQTKPVSVYRLVSKDTVEEEVLERARNKLLLEFITIQRGVTDKEASELKDKMARAGKSVAEPTSCEDISRILKRRGQRMFEQSGNQKKLEELDIDAVLANAEEHTTEEAERIEADGGEDFLKAFEFVDVKVDELSWDDIIPKEELEQIKAAEQKRKEEEFLAKQIEQNQPRKRKAVHDGREERQAKRRARQQVNLDADASDASQADDPSRPLTEKEYRNLFRAFLRYGEMDVRQDDILREARLEGRDINVVKAAIEELCEKARQHLDEENERLRALERDGISITKKERKAVLFDHRGVKRLNAETIVERPVEMRILREAISTVSDPKNFRVPEATKAADYSTQWTHREDGMILVGIARHGYGAWAQIRDDPDLGLKEKLFLDENRQDRKNERANGESLKSPGAVHLVRRADYLLSILKKKAARGAGTKTVDNYRVSKKATSSSRSHKSQSVSASPAPPAQPRVREQERTRKRPSSSTPGTDAGRTSMTTAKSEIKRLRVEKSRRHSNGSHDDMSREAMMKAVFEPVREQVEKIKTTTKQTFPDKHKRAAELRRLLIAVGGFIDDTLKMSAAIGLMPETLWEYVAKWWPAKDIDAKRLMNMYQKVLADREARKEQQR
ncbi:hypothetical protein VTO42DRAFT_847 [Malbranchea cinnamomea]